MAVPALATVFASVRGIVHDPRHRPIAGAQVTLHASGSDFSVQAVTDASGQFVLPPVPLGLYRLEVKAAGFGPVTEGLTLSSGTNPVVHVALAVSAEAQTVEVHDDASNATDTVTPTTLIRREEIEQTPGASRTLGMEMITDYVPGSYMTHDMLHIRGGHQTSWLIDGVSIPNTKIGSNVGPQIDPSDIDSLEAQRGSYGSDVGDRTYGVFNVLPRNGFERNREAELLLVGGNPYSGEAQLSLGDHSERTAWYASLTGSRSNYGLATPVPQIHHDATNSVSAFGSLIRNQTARDQVRLDTQFRQDDFQIPYDPDASDWEQASQYYQSFGLRDRQAERDAFVIANWVHTLSPNRSVSFAPFYHLNQADYDSAANDLPVATTWHQRSNYVGGQGDAHLSGKGNDLSGGFYSFYQAEHDEYGVQVNDGSGSSQPRVGSDASAALLEFYVADHVQVGRYIALLGGERFSINRAGMNETAVYPRLGATVEIPRLHWTLRGFYGHFFQPAPVQTVSSAVLNYAGQSAEGQNTFTALASERDEEHQFGLQVPYKGWTLDVDTFKSRVNNFLDHASLGESNLYFPIAIDGALVRAWEMTLRSPASLRFGQFHLAYSNQIAEQRGNIIGGFTCSIANDPECQLGNSYVPVDHDQRNTLNTGFTIRFPGQTWFSSNVYYGSGFHNGLAGSGIGPYQGRYLPAHTTFDLEAGRRLGDRWRVAVNVINATDHRVLLDNSITIGGFHYNDPRMISGEVRYRFRF